MGVQSETSDDSRYSLQSDPNEHSLQIKPVNSPTEQSQNSTYELLGDAYLKM